MVKRVTSIRLEEELLEKAELLNLNISKIAQSSIKYEVERKTLSYLRDGFIVPHNFPGVRNTVRILSFSKNKAKFKKINKLRVGDKIISYNESTKTLDYSYIISKERLNSTPSIGSCYRIFSYDTYIDVQPTTKIFCWPRLVSESNWYEAQDIQKGYSTFTTSTVARQGSHPIGSVLITEIQKDYVEDYYYLIEAYPYNTFIANSVEREILKPITIGASFWGFVIQGYPLRFSLAS